MTTDDETMSDLIDHFYDAVALTDSALQFWISITFAVIVGVHFVGDRLSRQMYLLMAGLYGLVSVVFLSRYIGASIQLVHYLNSIRAQYDWPVPWIYSAVAGYGTLVLLIFGTIGTLYFMHSVRKSGPRNGV
jgi:hypothetical protein